MNETENVIQSLRAIKSYLSSQAIMASVEHNNIARESLIESQANIERAIKIIKDKPYWNPIEMLPSGEGIQKVFVRTIFGDTIGWFNQKIKAWFFLEWYIDDEMRKRDYQHGENPQMSYTPQNTRLITHWRPFDIK